MMQQFLLIHFVEAKQNIRESWVDLSWSARRPIDTAAARTGSGRSGPHLAQLIQRWQQQQPGEQEEEERRRRKKKKEGVLFPLASM